MASAFETTVSVSEFKAKCLELMEAGASRRLDRVHVTKRGKPFLTFEVKVDEPRQRPTFDEIFGSMKDTVTLPPDFDWEQSPYTDAELDEQEARFEEKFKHLL